MLDRILNHRTRLDKLDIQICKYIDIYAGALHDWFIGQGGG